MVFWDGGVWERGCTCFERDVSERDVSVGEFELDFLIKWFFDLLGVDGFGEFKNFPGGIEVILGLVIVVTFALAFLVIFIVVWQLVQEIDRRVISVSWEGEDRSVGQLGLYE